MPYFDVGPAAQVDCLRTVGRAGIVDERDRRNSVGCTTAAGLVVGSDQALRVDVLAGVARNHYVVGGRAVIEGLEAVGVRRCTVTPGGYVPNRVAGDPVAGPEKSYAVGVAVIDGDRFAHRVVTDGDALPRNVDADCGDMLHGIGCDGRVGAPRTSDSASTGVMDRVVPRCDPGTLELYPVATGNGEAFDDDMVGGNVNIVDGSTVGDEFDRGFGCSRLGHRQVGIGEITTREADSASWRGGIEGNTHIVRSTDRLGTVSRQTLALLARA